MGQCSKNGVLRGSKRPSIAMEGDFVTIGQRRRWISVQMTRQEIDEVLRRKKVLRAEASARRAEQPDAQRASQEIFRQLAALPEYVRARTVMLYLDFLSEVRTRWFLPTAWSEGKHVVVPYCENGEIELFRLDHVGELAPAPSASWNRGVSCEAGRIGRSIERGPT